MLQQPKHRAATLTDVLSFFALNWESNWRLPTPGAGLGFPSDLWGGRGGGIGSGTLYDLYSLGVCTYKYICVFIFSVGHTHEGAHVSDMPVRSGPNTRQLWFAVHWR